MDVDCSHIREGISARVDGEEPPLPAERLDEHLARCADCREWQRGVLDLTRRLRVRPAEPVPDLVAEVLAARPARRRWPGLLLGAVAACQLLLGLVQVTGLVELGHGGHAGSMSAHLFNESTAWNLALGVGLLLSALRPRTAAGLLPVLSAFLVVLAGFSVVDLLNDAVPATRLLSHGFLVAGLVLLMVVRREHRDAPKPDAAAPPEHRVSAGRAAEPPEEDGGTERQHLRPVSHHAA
ncbi:Predicted anti-sigma-YlaC factor YlaD, contains Zn-finger domain [Saccharopolyspora antimicrobica]|uniref:Anti-sigma-YlaC factor YlaD n=1 Tax=Saccharopolyspora antimicrobica TaxID=455193 RepID=A0A1I4TRP2_9PSEU|nr:zf-HC2 domain-containing protein [Saccharopolyspora antimicrobica]RKT88518.1 putative anti-sigma-YlaC factor YlaD [Saccharopolyspora antimicrobica]SFM79217.1 Predicted anti-sigma-YlaC factor YlaD, contains Zn-finger domain [Saccharopolyspora antimicrobica]